MRGCLCCRHVFDRAERQELGDGEHCFCRFVAGTNPPLRWSRVTFNSLLYLFRKMPVFFLCEFVETCLSCWCAGNGFGESGATLCRVVHCAWRAVSMRQEVLTLRTILNISLSVEVVLSYVESVHRGRLCCRLGLVGRLVVDHPRFCGFTGFLWCG